MGFPVVSMKIPKCLHLAPFFLQQMVVLFKLIIMAAITHFALFKPPATLDEDNNDDDPSSRYVLLMDGGTCPSPVPVSVRILTELIKRKLPVVTYEALRPPESGDHDDGRCSVCLEEMEESDPVRELCNCRHVFHRECLERWVDQGQITCPLCRSLLFEEKTGVGDARRLQRDFFAALDDHH